MDRRAFHGASCAAIATVARATSAPEDIVFLPLRTPVVIPIDTVAPIWAAVPFKGRFTKSDGNDSLVPGLAVRTPRGVTAVCTYCPHELCAIRLDGHNLRCPCHFSLFDPERDGAWISGPALRRTYQFRFEVDGTNLVVTDVEAALERRLL